MGIANKRGSGWPALRRRIIARDGETCTVCGEWRTALEVDHIVPLKDGGTDADSNLRTLCHSCHKNRHEPERVADPEIARWRSYVRARRRAV